MKIAPLLTNDPWFPHIANHGKASIESLADVPVEATVLVQEVGFVHGGPDENYRPRLHLQGRLQKLEAPSVELPYGVQDMEFNSDHGPLMDAFYDFTAAQMAQLVTKGYFDREFEVPQVMKGLPYVLPTTARMMFVAPNSNDEPPVLFVEVENTNSLRVSQFTSGYDLASYFPDILLGREAQGELDPAAPSLDLAADGVDYSPERDLFADESAPEAPEPKEAVEAREAVEAEAELAGTAAADQDFERFYREQVASRLGELEGGAVHGDVLDNARHAASGGVELVEAGVLAFEIDGEDDGVAFTGDVLDFEEDDAAFDEELAQSKASYYSESKPVYAAAPPVQAAGQEAETEQRLDKLEEERQRMTRRAMRQQQHIAFAEPESTGSDDLELG